MNELNSLHRGYNFDLDRYGWHSTDYQGVLLTVARVRSTTPRYSINQLGRRCQQRCLNSGHVIRQQPSWTANVELPLFPSSECIFTAGGKSTIRRFEFRQTDRQTSTKRNRLTRDDPFLSSIFFFFYLLYTVISLYLLLFLPFFVASRSHNFLLLAYTTLSRTTKPSFVTLTLYENNYTFQHTYTRDACNDKFHPLDDVPSPFLLPPSSLSFILSPVFFSSIGMPLTSFNLLGLACFNRTIIGLRVSRRINKDLWSNYENRYGI